MDFMFNFDGIIEDHFSTTNTNQSFMNMENFINTDFGYCLDEYSKDEEQQNLMQIDELLDQVQQHNLFDEMPVLVPSVEVVERHEFSSSLLASLDLLNSHGNGFNRLKNIKPMINNRSISNDRKQTTEEILRIAGIRFVHSSSLKAAMMHPFQCSFSVLSRQESKDVQLVELLLASAEKVGFGNLENATRLLNLCENYLPCDARNPVQRVVYYFREALREKIDRKGKTRDSFDIDKAMIVPDTPKIAFHQGLPFSQVEKFAGIQAIIERVGGAKRVHVIDLRIANGVQWTVLMQALASRHECPLELLKITAIGTNSRHVIEETGKWLSNFASIMSIPFCFNTIMVPRMSNLKEDHFRLDTNEAIAVYSSFALSMMISEQTELESLMRVIRGLKPCVMVVTEVDANLNSPNFVSRFVEALFFYGTLFDLIEAFMKDDYENREILESKYSFEAIRSIVCKEGEERKVRHVKFDVWKAFFKRFGMVEIELSQSSISQANLVVTSFPCGDFCTLDFIGKCLLLCWKGTPLQFLSVWKFT